MARVDEFLNNGGADESGSTGNKDTHDDSPHSLRPHCRGPVRIKVFD